MADIKLCRHAQGLQCCLLAHHFLPWEAPCFHTSRSWDLQFCFSLVALRGFCGVGAAASLSRSWGNPPCLLQSAMQFCHRSPPGATSSGSAFCSIPLCTLNGLVMLLLRLCEYRGRELRCRVSSFRLVPPAVSPGEFCHCVACCCIACCNEVLFYVTSQPCSPTVP